ncbi:hypothetical protein C5167_041643 [Papaver somniferum]|nr:hypothetical protein C5167_041643 [Papaver somniferum]
MSSRLGYPVGCVILLSSVIFSIVQQVTADWPPPCSPWQKEGYCSPCDYSTDPFNKKIYDRQTVLIVNAFIKKKAHLWVKCQSQHHDVPGVMLPPGGRLEFEPQDGPKSECHWYHCRQEKYWCYMDWIDPVDNKKYGLTLDAWGYGDGNKPLYERLYEYVVNKDGIFVPVLAIHPVENKEERIESGNERPAEIQPDDFPRELNEILLEDAFGGSAAIA